MIDLVKEWPQVQDEATRQGVDPYFIMSIRMAENGGPGKEFGELTVPAPTYADQLRITCNTVRHHWLDYEGEYMVSNSRICYPYEFVQQFQERWAPIKVKNDPTDLNANWLKNVWMHYTAFIARKEVAVSVPKANP